MTKHFNFAMEDLLQFLYLAPVGIIRFSGDGAVDLVNPSASALLSQFSPDSCLKNIYGVFSAILPDLRHDVANFSDLAGTVLDLRRLECSSGESSLIVSLVVNRVNADTYMAVVNDITVAEQRDRAAFAEQQKLRIIVDSLHEYAIYTLSSDGQVRDWSPSLERHTGWPEEEMPRATFDMFLGDDPARPKCAHLLAETRRAGSIEIEGWQVRRDGGRTWTNTIITALPDMTGQLNGFAVVSRDMTERKRVEDEARRHACIDALTGAYNRRQGGVALTSELQRRARDGRPFALLMLDIDKFKDTNDLHGHAGGDAVLCALVNAAKGVLRSVDTLARWGGEEFIVILPDTDEASAIIAAERLRRVLADTQTPLSNGDVISFTVSIGVASATDMDAEALLRRADIALYKAKAEGRNRVVAAP